MDPAKKSSPPNLRHPRRSLHGRLEELRAFEVEADDEHEEAPSASEIRALLHDNGGW